MYVAGTGGLMDFNAPCVWPNLPPLPIDDPDIRKVRKMARNAWFEPKAGLLGAHFNPDTG